MPVKPPFHRPSRLEAEYRNALHKLLDKYLDLPNYSDLGELSARLAEWGKARSFFHNAPTILASNMITQVLHQNAVSWRQAATISSKGRLIHHLLMNELNSDLGKHVDKLIKRNSELIVTLPQRVTYTISNYIHTQQVAGVRSETIAKTLRAKFKNIRDYEIARLARTEVAKSATAITQVRAQNIGLNWYQWLTSEDARVRPSHRKMNLVLVNWNDPPAPELLVGMKSEGQYHAGEIYNCRCPGVPVVSLDEISFPAKIYQAGVIKRLTRNQFALLSGLTKQLAA